MNGLYYYGVNKWNKRGQYFLVKDGWMMQVNDITNQFYPLEPRLSPFFVVHVSRVDMSLFKRLA